MKLLTKPKWDKLLYLQLRIWYIDIDMNNINDDGVG